MMKKLSLEMLRILWEKKAKKIAKNLLKIGLTQEQVYL